MGTKRVTKGEKAMSEKNKSLVKQIVEIFNTGDLSAVDEIFSPDFVLHNPAYPEEVRGPAGVKRYVETVRAAFPDIEIKIIDMVAEGEKVAKHFKMSGTQQGEWLGIHPTNKRFSMDLAISIYRFSEGKLVELWMAYDDMTTARQLGLLPAPGEAAD
jgi:steroid delta-isomerase-like uncharacterized protein